MTLPMIANLARQDDKISLKRILEHDFSVAVREYAEANGWTVFYQQVTGHMGKDNKWKGMSPKGEPDLRIVKRGKPPIFAELKREQGTISHAQLQALHELGEYGRLWKPHDADAIMQELGV